MPNRIRLVKNAVLQGSNKDVAREPGASGFLKGHKKIGGRKKGVVNRTTRDLTQAILNAAESIGFLEYEDVSRQENGKVVIRNVPVPTGKDGLEGYLRWLGLERPQLFTPLLKAMLPFVVKGAIRAEPKREYTSMEEVEQRMRELGLPTNLKLLAD
jgi:hypothetical protein